MDDQEEAQKIVVRPETTVDAIIKFAHAFGVAGVVLAYLLWRGEPIIREHFLGLHRYMDASAETQRQQEKILSTSEARLTHIEQATDRTAELVRDLHGRLVMRSKPVESAEGRP